MKQKALEDMTNLDLIEGLIYDENIQDNLNVSNNYSPDEYGNSIVTIGFTSSAKKKQKSSACLILMLFNKAGRLVSLQVATKAKGDKHWQIAASDTLLDFTARFSSDDFKKKKKAK